MAGMDVALIRKCNIPEVEIAEDKHAYGGLPHDIKTAGKMKFGDINIEKVMPAGSSDTAAFRWLQTVIDPNSNVARLASQYKRTVLIEHLAPNGGIVGRWRVMGCWVKKLGYGENDAMKEAEALIEKITLCCDKYIREI